jgi:hypothetical protein
MAINIKKSHKGLLHKNLGVSQKKKLTMDQIMQAVHSPNPAIRKRGIFAKNARSFKH